MDTETETKLVAALWQVVAAEGWQGLTMHRLARAAGVPLEQVRRQVPCRLHLLKLHGRAMDAAALAGGAIEQHGTPRDRVFDVLMRRIDAMQPHRAGLLRLFEDVKRDPLLGLLLLAELPGSMAWMLESAGVSPAGLLGLLRVNGATAVWLATIRAWAKDDTQDLAPTMAALDKALDQAERVARSLNLRRGDAAAEPITE
jgi:ubiquinone biosynthesis protein COQ9